MTEEVMKYQIQKTVENHFEKERMMKDKGTKVLSLFFIDRVSNYRQYQNGSAGKGKFAKWFEQAFRDIQKNPKFKGLLPYQPQEVHNGYFSQDKKGVLKDTTGKSQKDDDTYALIMKDKETLLSAGEPLRFIFSHSALREGWDNPNVFQICTLNETQSELKKRQEIGRGLRLPVNKDGLRLFDDNVNILTVVANESYEDFAKSLQNELQEECGVDFSGRVKDKNKRVNIKLKKQYQLDENFKALWDKIKHKTRYQVEYNTEDLLSKASEALSNLRISKPKIAERRVRLEFDKEGVDSRLLSASEKTIDQAVNRIPDILSYIQSKTRLTKDTIFRIIKESGKMLDIFKNPQQFMDSSVTEINKVMRDMMMDGIKYEKIAGKYFEMKLFENEELTGYLQNLKPVNDQDKTLYDYVQVDSDIEKKFARELEDNEQIKFYVKLPRWFTIDTPIGKYNPDWAFVLENDKRIYFVAETKGTLDDFDLRQAENMKIKCGKKHFERLDGVKFNGPVEKLSNALFD